MKLKKVKNMKTNIIYGLLYRFLSLLFPFIIRTVMIHYLSAEYLGLSSLFVSILQALNLVELGIGSALVFNMYKPVAENDTKKIGAYLNFYKKCYRIIGLIILILGISIMPFLSHLIKGSYPREINLYYIYFIYLINTVLTYWMFAYKNSVALAYQRTDIENKALLVSQTLMYIFQIVLLMYFKNYYYYIILLPIFTVIKNIIVSKKIKKEYPNIIGMGDITNSEKKAISKNIKALFGHQIAFTIINSADSVILSMLLGLNELAIYNNYYYVFSAIVNIITILFTSIQAGIGNDVITNNKEEIFKNFKRFRLIVFIIVGICSMCFLTLYQPFMKIWMGKTMMLSEKCVIIFVIGFFITQVRRVITTYKNATGMWREDFYKPYVVIIVDIIIDFILINRIGSIGAMVSTIVSMGLIAIPWEIHVIYKHLFKKSKFEYYRFFAKEIVIFAINCLIMIFIVNFIHLSGIINIIIRLIVTILISASIYLISHYNDEEFKWCYERLKKLIKYKE